jgi:hypothetical protein
MAHATLAQYSPHASHYIVRGQTRWFVDNQDTVHEGILDF